jgi:hypothetical protein
MSEVSRVAAPRTPSDAPSTVGRCQERVARVSGMLARPTVTAQTVTNSPTRDGRTSRSALIAGSSPAGSISRVTVQNAPKERSSSGRQGRVSVGAGARLVVVMQRR